MKSRWIFGWCLALHSQLTTAVVAVVVAAAASSSSSTGGYSQHALAERSKDCVQWVFESPTSRQRHKALSKQLEVYHALRLLIETLKLQRLLYITLQSTVDMTQHAVLTLLLLDAVLT
eukprot:8894-Heterococcus_DN1.PRE.2